ncbi:MAG: ArsR/SmtB family transcription factor [Candidatus Baldrarchaeia archaeon]
MWKIREDYSDTIVDLLQKPAYTEVLLCIIGKKNYASVIARILGKKQPTVTEQLKELERANLIKPLKRGKSQRYAVNWDTLLGAFYEIVNEVIEVREEYLEKKDVERIKKVGLEKIVPPRLIKTFLREYFSTFRDLGGKKKAFDELVFSFFAAINSLEKPLWKKLIKKFEIDEKSLSFLASLIEFEMYAIEITALETYLSSDKEGDVNG